MTDEKELLAILYKLSIMFEKFEKKIIE